MDLLKSKINIYIYKNILSSKEEIKDIKQSGCKNSFAHGYEEGRIDALNDIKKLINGDIDDE